jgi:hypothetical protein
MDGLSMAARIGALGAGRILAAVGRVVAFLRRPRPLRAELSSRRFAAARLAIFNHAEREARFYGLSDEALAAMLVELGRDVRAGRFRR